MKTFLLLVSLLLVSFNTYAEDPISSRFGIITLNGKPSVYSEVTYKPYNISFDIHFLNTFSGISLKKGFKINENINLYIGVTNGKVDVSESDISGNWDYTTLGNWKQYSTPFIEVEHNNFFIRLLHSDSSNTYLFQETNIVNDNIVVLDSKLVTKNYSNTYLFIGYRSSFE